MTAHFHAVEQTPAQQFQNSIVPLLRYRDLSRAMDWLHEVFGFEKQLSVSDSDGELVYGQMRYGSSLVMLGTVRDTDLDGFMTQPDEVGGFETQTCYVAIDDAEEHFSRAVMAGADILLELKSDANGRRGYACRDPEGHIWNFGTFHPTMPSLTTVSEAQSQAKASVPSRWPLRLAMAASLVLALMAGFVSRDFVPLPEAGSLSIAAEEGTADYAYQLLAVVRGEARELTAQRDRLKGQLEALAADKAKIEIEARTAAAQADTEKAQRASLEAQLASTREELKARAAAEEAALQQVRDAQHRLEIQTREKISEAVTEHLQVQAAREAAGRNAETLNEGNRSIETSATTPADAPRAAETSQPSATQQQAAVEPPAAVEPKAAPAVAQGEKNSEDAAPAKDRPSVVKRTSAAAKKHATPTAKAPRYQPTYLIEMSDVPWPYTTWHQSTK